MHFKVVTEYKAVRDRRNRMILSQELLDDELCSTPMLRNDRKPPLGIAFDNVMTVSDLLFNNIGILEARPDPFSLGLIGIG